MREIEPSEMPNAGFLSLKKGQSRNFAFCVCSLPPRYLSFPLTLIEYNVTWSTEIWLYEPTAVKDIRKN